MIRSFALATGLVSGLVLAAAGPAAAEGTYKVDAVHSTVLFRVKHMDASYAYGRFNEVAGHFVFDDKDPAQSEFDFQVKAASIDTGNPKRDQHLKGPDFFNTVQFPTITFKSRTVAAVGKDVFQVTGDLTLHGVTQPVSLRITRVGQEKARGKAIAGFETVFPIKRTAFKMTQMVGPIGDDVTVTVSVEGGQ